MVTRIEHMFESMIAEFEGLACRLSVPADAAAIARARFVDDAATVVAAVAPLGVVDTVTVVRQ